MKRLSLTPRYFNLALLIACMGGLEHLAKAGALPEPASRKIDFPTELQPLFAEKCYGCHGEKKQESGLRMDNRADLLKGGDNGPALVAGKSGESILVQVLAGTHPDLAVMPKKKEKLTGEQIGLVRAWIDQGAEWADGVVVKNTTDINHWAFKAPVRPPVPPPANPEWPRTPIDNFILAKLTVEKLQPSPEADKTTLLRRLSLDLIGLPPTPAEVDAFLADPSPDAYAKQVERLLASPHYGERWGRHWLDAARYADSDGYEKDKPRFVWPYRDWVVAAFNRDLPYDQFVTEQIAGDLLPDATPEQIVATGFLRNSMVNEEGGADPEQFRMEAMFDRMDCIGKSVLGLTIQCAQCHNHKFDPLSQQDYFRLFSFLNNDHEASTITYPGGQQMVVADLSRQMGDLEAALRHTTPDWSERMSQWEDAVKNDQPVWTPVRVVNASENNGTRYYDFTDGSLRAASYGPAKSTAHFRGISDVTVIGAFQLEQLTDPNLPGGGPGRSIKGMSALSEFSVEVVDPANPDKKIAVKFVKATADFSHAEKELEAEFDDKEDQKRVYGPVEFAIDRKKETAWGIDAGPGRRNQARKAVFIPTEPVQLPKGSELHFYLQQVHGGWNNNDNQNHNLGRFRLSVTSAGDVVADPLPAAVRGIFKTPRNQRSPAQVAAVFRYWRTVVPEFKEVNDRIEELWKRWPEGTPAFALHARRGETAGDEKRTTHLFKRGDWLKPGDPVTSGTPGFLHPMPADADPSRLTLAKWLVDRKAPTTARAFVNRIWQNYFGDGLVTTPEDFGVRCELPSHPELLDWLACEFMDSGWSIKHIHRLIVASATYRQASRVTPEQYARDPYNHLLARGPRFRVEGEIVRDIALAASGLLNPALGGRSVYPPAPDFLFLPPASYGTKTWTEDTGPDRYRRSLYIFKFRSTPFPMLQTFDAPNGDFSCVRRQRSNTPLQALVTLNEPVFNECAQALARLTLADGGATDPERLAFAFRRALSRQPTVDETHELLALLTKGKTHVSEGWVNALELATGRNEPPAGLPAGTTPTELAAYTIVTRVLLNLDETITKE